MTLARLGVLAAIVLAAGCSGDAEAARPRVFAADGFPGLVSDASAPYASVELDYELGTPGGDVVRFTSCKEVEATTEDAIDPSEQSLLRQLRLNCEGLRRFGESKPASQSYFPDALDAKLLSELPATAVPRDNDEEIERRQGQTLGAYEPRMDVTPEPDGTLRLDTETDELLYHVLARADFDGDGTEDLLVRVDARARGALGVSSDLLLLRRSAPGAPIALEWRY